jgi:adenosylcobinamide-GDP ribazoletransferase
VAADLRNRPVRLARRRITPGTPLAELLAAVGFLTRVPVPTGSARGTATEPRTGAAAFGIVGLGLGIVAALPIVVGGGVHPMPAAILSLALLAILSGALHLDGLADTADALAAPAGAADRARTDPRAGSAGVIALVLVLGLDVALLAELAVRGPLAAGVALVAAAAVSRASAPVAAVTLGRLLPPAAGLGRWFAEATSTAAAIVAVGSAVVAVAVLAAIAGPWVLAAVALGALGAAILGGAIVRARGGFDGDGYGALVEITFSAVLLAAAIVR